MSEQSMLDFEEHWNYSYRRLYGVYSRDSHLYIELPDISFLKVFYTESERRYHNQEHINYLMELNNCVQPLGNSMTSRERQQIELFIWFHDIIYSVRDPADNELKSALLFETVYRKWVFTNAVRDAILSSKHIPEPIIKEPWALYCLDLDLAAIGDANEAQWHRNNDAIRAENEHIQDHTYNRLRYTFFCRLLERGWIYHNPYKLDWFTEAETIAQQRIKTELSRLKILIDEWETSYRESLTI